MEYIVNGLLILLLGTLYFFAIRYLFRKGTCAGCSSCKSHRGGLLLFYRIRRLRWLLRPLYSLYPLRLFSAGRAANRRAPPQLILRIPLRRSLSCFPRQKNGICSQFMN